MMTQLEAERWKPVPHWEGFYEISSHGRVRSVPRVVERSNGRCYNVASRILAISPKQKGEGRPCVTLNGRGSPKDRHVTLSLDALLREVFGPDDQP